MRSLIVYYSYSGNTKKVAEFLYEYLRQRGEVDCVELKAQDEGNGFLGQCRRALTHQRAKISPLNFDLNNYDLICLGSPVWAFAPAPAINTFIDQAQDFQGKSFVLFTTYGSGTGNNRCLNYMQKMLVSKGASDFKRFSIPGVKANNRDFARVQIEAGLT